MLSLSFNKPRTKHKAEVWWLEEALCDLKTNVHNNTSRFPHPLLVFKEEESLIFYVQQCADDALTQPK